MRSRCQYSKLGAQSCPSGRDGSRLGGEFCKRTQISFFLTPASYFYLTPTHIQQACSSLVSSSYWNPSAGLSALVLQNPTATTLFKPEATLNMKFTTTIVIAFSLIGPITASPVGDNNNVQVRDARPPPPPPLGNRPPPPHIRDLINNEDISSYKKDVTRLHQTDHLHHPKIEILKITKRDVYLQPHLAASPDHRPRSKFRWCWITSTSSTTTTNTQSPPPSSHAWILLLKPRKMFSPLHCVGAEAGRNEAISTKALGRYFVLPRFWFILIIKAVFRTGKIWIRRRSCLGAVRLD